MNTFVRRLTVHRHALVALLLIGLLVLPTVAFVVTVAVPTRSPEVVDIVAGKPGNNAVKKPASKAVGKPNVKPQGFIWGG